MNWHIEDHLTWRRFLILLFAISRLKLLSQRSCNSFSDSGTFGVSRNIFQTTYCVKPEKTLRQNL
jgi:hypothetical protein